MDFESSDSGDADDVQRLQQLLDQVPAPLTPLDVSAVDGFLCGLLLQPEDVDARDWLACITDVDARPLPPGFDAAPLHALLQRRHALLKHAIAARRWFDPWVFELDAPASVSECVLPWVAGFATAMERFPGLMRSDDAGLLEPLALIYLHFDADDLDDAESLQAMIDSLEPPADLAEAVQDLVRSVMLLADVTRPRAPAAPPARKRRR
ncbi:MAG TPA: YecA family protein [Rubrivivax sp.]|nr:YecA family protein [Rubrivivax sp.]